MRNFIKNTFTTVVVFIGLTCSFFSTNGFAQTGYGTSFFPIVGEYTTVIASGTQRMTLEIDNDSLLLNRDDGFYTSGIHLISRTSLSSNPSNTATVTYGWQFGQDLYTASNINLAPEKIAVFDHPYAGWLYFGAFKETNNNHGNSTKIGLDVGCLGPCAGGEWTQTHLHRLLKQPLPQGWRSQLKQEWGAVVSADWSPARWNVSSHVDISPKIKGRAGNIFTDASAEFLWRAGRLNTLPEHSANFFSARAELKLVAYNATLQGGYFTKQQLPIHPRRTVLEGEIAYTYQELSWGLRASILRRTSEIAELSQAKASQNFVRLQLMLAM